MVTQIWCHPSRSTSKALQGWRRLTVETPPFGAEMVNVGWAWGPGRGGLDWSQAVGRTHLLWQLFFGLESPLLSQPVNIPPIFPGSAQTHSPMKPSWSYLSSCWVPKALFTTFISPEGPVLFWSIICTHAHSFSQLLGGKLRALSSVLDPDTDYF